MLIICCPASPVGPWFVWVSQHQPAAVRGLAVRPESRRGAQAGDSAE